MAGERAPTAGRLTEPTRVENPSHGMTGTSITRLAAISGIGSIAPTMTAARSLARIRQDAEGVHVARARLRSSILRARGKGARIQDIADAAGLTKGRISQILHENPPSP